MTPSEAYTVAAQVAVMLIPVLAAGYEDVKHRRVTPRQWKITGIIGFVCFLAFPGDIMLKFAMLAVLGGFGMVLWNANVLGGGDAKILIALGFGLPYASLLPFFLALGASSTVYGRLKSKYRDNIPMVACMAFALIVCFAAALATA
jgi:Flp pilus assembly protein protease CpaA